MVSTSLQKPISSCVIITSRLALPRQQWSQTEPRTGFSTWQIISRSRSQSKWWRNTENGESDYLGELHEDFSHNFWRQPAQHRTRNNGQRHRGLGLTNTRSTARYFGKGVWY